MLNDPGLLQGVTAILALALLGCGVLLVIDHNREELRKQQTIFLVALVLRFLVSVAIYQFGFVKYVGDQDASGWFAGVILANEWKAQNVSLLELPFRMVEAFHHHHKGYNYLLGTVFYLTDSPYRLVASALNAFFGALIAVMTYRIARVLFSGWVAGRAAWWTALFPSMIIWSALTVKEPIVILLESIALYGCVRLRQLGMSPRHVLLCTACVVLLVPFRFYASYIVAVAVVASFLAGDITKPRRAIAAVFFIALLVPAITATGAIARYERQIESFDADRVESFRRAVGKGGSKTGTGSGVESTFDMHTPSGLALGTAVGGAHLLLAPFPWQLGGGSARLVGTGPELLYWWWLVFVGVIPGAIHCFRKRLPDILSTVVFIGGFGLLYSMMFGNVGLIFRQRAQLLPWLLIFAAVGLELRAQRREATRAAAWTRITQGTSGSFPTDPNSLAPARARPDHESA